MQADSLSSEPPGKPKNTGVTNLSLLQWIFPAQESNQGLLHCRVIFFFFFFTSWVTRETQLFPAHCKSCLAIRKQTINKNRNFSQFYAPSPLRFGAIHTSICRIKGPAFSCLTVRRKGFGYPGRMQISVKRSFENKTYSCLPRISWMWA